MKSAVLLLVLVLAISVSSRRRKHNEDCNKYGLKCVDNNTFTFCFKSSKYFADHLPKIKCRHGYVCQETSRYPCVAAPSTTTQAVTESVTASVAVTQSVRGSTVAEPSTTTEAGPENVTVFVAVTEPEKENTVAASPKTTEPVTDVVTDDPVAVTTVGQEDGSIADSGNESQPQTQDLPEPSNEAVQEVIETTESTVGSVIVTTIAQENNIIADSGTESSPQSEDLPEPSTEAPQEAIKITESTVGTEKTTNWADYKNYFEETIENWRKKFGDKGTGGSSWPKFSKEVNTPQCSGEGTLAGPSCQQYYECEIVFKSWYRPVLKTCPEGQSFSSTESQCVSSALNDCTD